MNEPHPIPNCSRFQNHTGKTFGLWEVLYYLGRSQTASGKKGKAMWLCRCQCSKGTVRAVAGSNLTSGFTRSCGCEKDRKTGERFRTHGMSETSEFLTWQVMRKRCNYERHNGYEYYGGAGKVVCVFLAESFENFASVLGRKPTPEHTIDRIDNTKGYECGDCPDCASRDTMKRNVRWATRAEQARNRSDNVIVEIDGVSMIFTDWVKKAGLNECTVRYRLKAGWSMKDALLTPPYPNGRGRKGRNPSS